MKIQLFYTNDIHSEYGRLAGIKHYLNQVRKPGDLLLDGGDFCDLKSLIIQGSQGLAAVDILKTLGYDAITIGNNEIDLEHDRLAKLAAEDFAFLSCNITANDQQPIPGVRPSIIIERQGIRFLIIGISPYYSIDRRPDAYNTFFKMGNITSIDPETPIRREIAGHHGQYDVCILLSHSGIRVEQFLCEQIAGIDICLGAHSHSVVTRPRRFNDTYYIQAGWQADWLGRLELTFADRELTAVTGGLIANEFADDPTVLLQLDRLQAQAVAAMDQPLYQIGALDWDAYRESGLTNFICDALYYEYPCDFSLMHAGIVSGPVSGSISRMTLLELSPSKLNPTRFRIRGADLLQAIRMSFDDTVIHQEGRGPGFRGHCLGTLGFSHNVRIDREALLVQVNGTTLDPEHEYDCVSDDYLQRGTGYGSLKTTEAIFYRGFIRDLLERQLANPELWQTCKQKRIY